MQSYQELCETTSPGLGFSDISIEEYDAFRAEYPIWLASLEAEQPSQDNSVESVEDLCDRLDAVVTDLSGLGDDMPF